MNEYSLAKVQYLSLNVWYFPSDICIFSGGHSTSNKSGMLVAFSIFMFVMFIQLLF